MERKNTLFFMLIGSLEAEEVYTRRLANLNLVQELNEFEKENILRTTSNKETNIKIMNSFYASISDIVKKEEKNKKEWNDLISHCLERSRRSR